MRFALDMRLRREMFLVAASGGLDTACGGAGRRLSEAGERRKMQKRDPERGRS